ncbi:MAG: NUDIX hydrolase [Verrucomicrobiota bacterium]
MPPLPYKISTLVYVENPRGEILLMKRRKAPNAGLWSPIGGKLEMATGESPFEAARREVAEEIRLTVADADLHLFGMIAEKAYEDSGHWLMFLFAARTRIEALPPDIAEGHFAFFAADAVADLPIPETDRQALWPIYREHRHGFVSLRATCHSEGPLEIVYEQVLPDSTQKT